MKSFFKKNIEIESVIISLRTVTVVMLFYFVGYCINLTMTLEGVYKMPFRWLRFVTAFFASLGLATGLLLVSIHKHEDRRLPLFFAFMDFVAMMLIFSVGEKGSVFEFLGYKFNIYIPTFRQIFFSVLKALIGYQLVSVFVNLMKKAKEGLERNIRELLRDKSDLLADISEIKQGKSEEERRLREVLASLKEEISEEERLINERLEVKKIELQGFEKRTCKCGAVFGSINGLNAHKGRCKEV